MNSGRSVELPPVSVVIPARNAESVIASALDSIAAQDYGGPVEVIVADGSDTPAMSELISRRYPAVRLVSNPQRTTPNGLNAALRVATGRVVVRCDCHAVLPPQYVRRAVETLEKTGAAGVGGRQQPVGETVVMRAVGMAMTTPLGAGDARYRLGGLEGRADTCYLGVYRRDALDAVGGFDPALDRCEDSDLNWRLRKRGEIVWFDPALVVFYRPRGSLRALARQYFDYGRWKPVVLRRHPAELRARHLAAPLLVSGLSSSALLALAGTPGAAAAALALVYVTTLILGAVTVGMRRRDATAVLLPVVLATIHLCWGSGFLLSIIRSVSAARGGCPVAQPRLRGRGGGVSRVP